MVGFEFQTVLNYRIIQQDRDMIARELLLKFQMSDRHPLVTLRKGIYEIFKMSISVIASCLQTQPRPDFDSSY